MPSRRQVRCPRCGTLVSLTKGQPMPTWEQCDHMSRTSVNAWMFDGSAEHDGPKYFAPRLNLNRARVVSTAVRLPKPASMADEKAKRREAEEIQQRRKLRQAWAEIVSHLARATDKQIEAYRLHVEQGLTIKVVADKLSVSERAAKDRIEAARRHEQASRQREKVA
jgi:hypothetical protein